MIVDSVCRRTIVKPKASTGMKMRKTENVGKNSRTGNKHISPTKERRSLKERTLLKES